MSYRAVFGVGAMVVAVVSAAPAHADQHDFVVAVDDAGIAYPDNDLSQMVTLGKAVCHDLRGGTAPDRVAAKLGGLGYAGYEQGTIMAAAANGMCPDTWPVLAEFAYGTPTPTDVRPCAPHCVTA
jgi:hypothetical protein